MKMDFEPSTGETKFERKKKTRRRRRANEEKGSDSISERFCDVSRWNSGCYIDECKKAPRLFKRSFNQLLSHACMLAHLSFHLKKQFPSTFQQSIVKSKQILSQLRARAKDLLT